jgi:beta-phosphoglucomutase
LRRYKLDKAKWGVIFDVDGTMVDNKDFHRKAWIELCRRYGMELTGADYRRLIHARPNDRIVPDLFGADIAKTRAAEIALEKETIYRSLYRPHIRPIAGLLALLDELKGRDIPCGAASNSPKGNVDLVLDELCIRSYFDSVICSDDVSNGKPDPELFLTAAARLNLSPQQCIVFEDSSPGFEAARRARCVCIAITSGADSEHLTSSKSTIAMHKDYTTITFAQLQNYLVSA